MLPIYAASETPIEGVEARLLADAIRAHGHRRVTYLPSAEAAVGVLAARLSGDDILLTLGAGDVWRIGPQVLARLAGKNGGI